MGEEIKGKTSNQYEGNLNKCSLITDNTKLHVQFTAYIRYLHIINEIVLLQI